MTPSSESKKKLSLASLKPGERGVVVAVSPNNSVLCSKLLSMGLVEGTLVQVIGAAPFGDPIEIRARGYNLSLRNSEAQAIEVSLLAEAVSLHHARTSQ